MCLSIIFSDPRELVGAPVEGSLSCPAQHDLRASDGGGVIKGDRCRGGQHGRGEEGDRGCCFQEHGLYIAYKPCKRVWRRSERATIGRRNCHRLSCFPFFPALPGSVAREAFRATYRVYGPVTDLQLCLRVPTGAVDALLQDRRRRLSTSLTTISPSHSLPTYWSAQACSEGCCMVDSKLRFALKLQQMGHHVDRDLDLAAASALLSSSARCSQGFIISPCTAPYHPTTAATVFGEQFGYVSAAGKLRTASASRRLTACAAIRAWARRKGGQAC